MFVSIAGRKSVLTGNVQAGARTQSGAHVQAWKRAFAEQGRDSLWHMTHWRNVPGILARGLLNHGDSRRSGTFKVDISLAEVQRLRIRPEPCYGQPICHYVPLYIEHRNPMLYSRRYLQHEVCLLEVALDCLDDAQFVVTDGNAASRDTRFYRSAADAVRLPWDVLNDRSWYNHADGSRKRCAEVLVHRHVDARHVRVIHCMSGAVARAIVNPFVDVHVSSGLYFGC